MADKDITKQSKDGDEPLAGKESKSKNVEADSSDQPQKTDNEAKSDSSSGETIKYEDTAQKLSANVESTSKTQSPEEMAAAKTDIKLDQKSDESKTGAPRPALKISSGSEEKSESSTLTDKSSESARLMLIKGVESFVQKVKSFGSPKRKVDSKDSESSGDSAVKLPSWLKYHKSQMPQKMELSSEADSRSSEGASIDETENLKMTAQELTAEGKLSSEKSSPLKNILEKCRELVRSPKTGYEIGQSTSSTQTSDTSVDNRPTSLGTTISSDLSSKTSSVLKSVMDKTKDFIKRKASLLLEQDSFSSPESENNSDTISSGALADISCTDTTTASSPSDSSETQKPDNPELQKEKEHESGKLEDVEEKTSKYPPPSPQQAPPLKRQKKIQEPSLDIPDETAETSEDTKSANLEMDYQTKELTDAAGENLKQSEDLEAKNDNMDVDVPSLKLAN